VKPTESDDEFEQWLERELRLHAASAQVPGPRAAEPAYRGASREGRHSVIFGKAAVGVAMAVLTATGGSALAMAATGSHSPGELAQSVAQIVEACKDTVRAADHDQQGATDGDTHAASAARNTRGIGQCVSSQVHKNKNGEAQQQENGVRDADDRGSAGSSTSPGTHQDHGGGAGSGSAGAPGHDGADHHGNSGHRPSPSPRS